MMKIALIYPPTCDPTGPCLSLPTLTGYLLAQIFGTISGAIRRLPGSS